MNPQDEICLSSPDNQCLLDNSISPIPLPASNSSCNQGNIPPYVLTVQDASDVMSAFEFARAHQVPISVTNSGHDYMLRNMQRGSLMLWMHHVQHITYNDTFTPEGCAEDGQHTYGPVMTVGTGVSSDAATAFATAHNATLLVGSSPTVAISGGWILGAGHSVLSPVYGLGVDRVVQFTIVTPDGVLRTASACQNDDLFWALRGGGGGTFGVVLDATHRVEHAPMPIAVANMTLPADISAGVAVEWIALQAKMGLAWGREGWGGHGAGKYLTHVNPLPQFANMSDGNASAAAQSMRGATEFVTAHGGTSVVEVLPSWADVWAKYIKPQARPVGGLTLGGGRLWPQRLFETEEAQETVLGFVKRIAQRGIDPRSIYIPADFPFLVPGSSSGYDTDTSTHPAWYTSLWNFGGLQSLAWNSSYRDRLQAAVNVTEMSEMAKELTGPEGGAYVHETNPFTLDWNESFWGPNYGRLLQIKKKYDPDMLLRCWKCVGFENPDLDAPMFNCQGILQKHINHVVLCSAA